jgi:SAM-dependent methyltransferase
MATLTFAQCRVCGESNHNQIYTAREMMFGFRDEFDYFECAGCSCLQIKEIPADLSKYYPENYYSYSEKVGPESASSTSASSQNYRMLKYILDDEALFEMFLSRMFGTPPKKLKRLKLNPDSAILDVGCGIGNMLLYLRQAGFSSLTGVDPFIREDIFYNNGVRIFKKDLSQIDAQFDFIILNFSLEHMPEPVSTFKNLGRVLKADGAIFIKIPVFPSFVWRHYGTNWVQLDAPRHLFLHSIASVQCLAGQSNLKICDIEFDSSAFQFWGSEQYARDIPLFDERSYMKNPEGSVFSKQEILGFKKRAKELNEREDGDQACFLLTGLHARHLDR